MNNSCTDCLVSKTIHYNYSKSWDSSDILLLLIVIAIIIISVLGNALVILSWILFPSIRSPSNVLLVSLAVVDLLYVIYSTTLNLLYTLNNHWILGERMCCLWISIGYALMFVSSNHLILVAIDRYRILLEGVPYLQRRSVRHALLQVGFLLLIAFCFICAFYFGWEEISMYYHDDKAGWMCGTKTTSALVVLLTLATTFGPFLGLIFIYSKVFKEL